MYLSFAISEDVSSDSGFGLPPILFPYLFPIRSPVLSAVFFDTILNASVADQEVFDQICYLKF